MVNKKNTGSYYTPKILSDFLVNHIVKKYLKERDLSILEPSCGDGEFILSLFKNLKIKSRKNITIDLFDINKTELDKASKLIPLKNTITKKIYNQDYLKFFLNNQNKYSLIIGNPPYIKKNNLEEEQILSCEAVHQKVKKYSDKVKSNGKIKNIWPAFIEANIMSLTEEGILCLVIPAEILQVKYAQELRALISDEFDRVEVFAFNELIFEGIQQDVVALIGVKGIENINEHGFSFYQVEALSDLKEPRFTEKHSNIHRTSLDKWTNYILTDDELNFIDELRNNYHPIKNYCEKAQVGIVSAANDYFILNDVELKQSELNRHKNIVKPILPKGYFVPNVASFNDDDFRILKEDNRKVNFLHFPDTNRDKFEKKICAYIDKGEKMKLHERYKMTKRKNWYHVPTIWKSEGLFIKRSHMYPKIFVNAANTLATDSFYRLLMRDDYNIKNLVFSFYNSFTFVLSELEGRYYGGGVLELTPNEFKNLSIPYNTNITDEQFDILDKMLRNKVDITDVLAYTNSILFNEIDLDRLEEIRIKLVDRRIKNNRTAKATTEKMQLEPINNYV